MLVLIVGIAYSTVQPAIHVLNSFSQMNLMQRIPQLRIRKIREGIQVGANRSSKNYRILRNYRNFPP